MHMNANRNGSRTLPMQLDESIEPADLQTTPQAATADSIAPGSKDGWTPVASPNLATRFGAKRTDGIGKNKLLLLGCGLGIAVLFFVFTAIVGKSPKKRTAGIQPAQGVKQESTQHSQGSVTPVMETVRLPAPDNSSGQLGPNDIRRTRTLGGRVATNASADLTQGPTVAKTTAVSSLGNVPSFADTQQKWEDPQPYGQATPASASQTQQQQNALKEPSLVFVRSQAQSQAATTTTRSDDIVASLLEMTPGTRIQAKLQTQISSAVQAPVVAIVEYTYAVGDKVIIPAGARVYGQLQQADRSGLVSVKFDEIELLDGAREKIEAIGTGLDLGPIRGDVSGKNTGKNFLVRAASGMGSVLAQIAGNNNSAAFSEGDMLRERLAENIGTAGDSEVMNLNANSRIVVSVPADTKIYIVFTKHEENQAQLHKVTSATP